MKTRNHLRWIIVLLILLSQYSFAQNNADWKNDMARLKTAGSVLFIGVSPEDYNKPLVTYLLHQNYRVGFLSLTRGENSDIDSVAFPLAGIQRGIYHVNKAIAQLDKSYSDLYFTRAYDFFSDGREDSIAVFGKLWSERDILGDIVWTIRGYEPDAIIFPSEQYLGKKGKRFYALQMIRTAIKMASDSDYFKEQFDDSRYAWIAKRVIALDAIHGSKNINLQNFGNLRYDIVAGQQPKNTLLDDVDVTWKRIYSNLDNGYFSKYLDSIKDLQLDRAEQLSILLDLRTRVYAASFWNQNWRVYKDRQLDQLLLQSSGVKFSIDFLQPFLVLGKPYRYKIQYMGDTSLIQLSSIKFGRFDTLFQNFPAHFSVEKQYDFAKNETSYQPYWLASPMVTSGMYAIASRDELDNPTNSNPFVASMNVLIKGLRFKFFQPAYFTKNADSIKEMPIITLPGFANIAPNVILTHLQKQGKRDENVFAQLQPNFSGKSIPVRINIIQKGTSVRVGKEPVNVNTKATLLSKDTIVDLENGKPINWIFSLSQKALDSLEEGLGVEIWLGKEPNKLKINSSLVHIPMNGLPDIDYHYQPRLTILNKDTFRVNQRGKLLVLTDSNNYITLANIKMLLNSLHTDFASLDLSTKGLKDRLPQYRHVLLAGPIHLIDDSAITTYVSNGGNLILLPFNKDRLPRFIQDSVLAIPSNLFILDNASINVDDTVRLFTYPNRIPPLQYPSAGIVATYNWTDSLLHQATQVLKYNVKGHAYIPILYYRYGKGSVVLNSLIVDDNMLTKPFIYKLLANIISQ